MARTFNTAGPCRPDLHYMIPAERRLPQAWGLVEEGAYFVVHAPRQTGKTTALRALAADLTASGKYAALHFSCETAEVAGDEYGAAEDMLLSTLAHDASGLPPDLRPPRWPEASPGTRFGAALSAWAQACPRPLVLIFDDVDALHGKSLLSLLRQLRAGFSDRPTHFPASVILCGLHGVRDYDAASGGDPYYIDTSGGFDVKTALLRMSELTESEVRELYAQHTAETGQSFTERALSHAWDLTRGQPWLINALGHRIVLQMAVPAGTTITATHIKKAKQLLILEHTSHLDSLLSNLHEPRVRRVLEPIVTGLERPRNRAEDLSYINDIAYIRDLGLIAPERFARVANPIYEEVIFRTLGIDHGPRRNLRVRFEDATTPSGRSARVIWA